MILKWAWALQQTGKQPLSTGDAAWFVVVYAIHYFYGSWTGWIVGIVAATLCATVIRLLSRKAEKAIPKLAEME